MRKHPHADSGFYVWANPSRAFDEAKYRREPKLKDVRMRGVIFLNVPIGDMGLADQAEVESTDFPPAQFWIPDDTKVGASDIMICEAAGNLHAKLVGMDGRGDRSEREKKHSASYISKQSYF